MTPDKNFIVIFITTKDTAQAETIAQELLAQKLIACANIVPAIKSLFWWEGKIDSSNEALLVLKTLKKSFPRVTKSVKALHSYSVPEIIALPIVAGQQDYLKWVEESVR